MRLVTLIALILLCGNLHAAAGRAIFVFGDAQIVSADGNQRWLLKNAEVNNGDLIITGKNGVVQLRMIDKAFIAIRSNSEFKIENYILGATKEEDSAFFSLLKGGFRAITGAIGKRLKSAYRVGTNVATIGIRGTDYTARLCDQDCNNNFGAAAGSTLVDDGLYVGVIDGGIELTNKLGTLDLDELQYGYVRDAASAPVALLNAPEFLFFRSRPPNSENEDSDGESSETIKSDTVQKRQVVEPDTGDISSDSSLQEDTNINRTDLTPEDVVATSSFSQSIETDSGVTVSLDGATVGAQRSVVSTLGDSATSNSITTVSENFFDAMTIENGAVTRFEGNALGGGFGPHSIGTATTLDLGFDPVTGISWGRWSGGTASFNNSATGANASIDLTARSLHWVSGPDRVDVTLPLSGTINYQLIGNTSPTDNLGNTGVLGAASLSADFNNMTTSTTVDIGINNQVWNASGNGVIQTNGDFAGTMSVTGTDSSTGAFSGTGSNAGFFTDNAAGAGMGYALEADVNSIPTNVTGTAVFQPQ
ncbi:MAG: FecR domain-containing protein [Gammaproteobacteria bacterium]|nr:FecR domain-containing protein [Gammaproteobacteria bacterium]